jgi:hypothetical protein
MVQYSSVIDGLTFGLYDPNRERSPTVSPDTDARAQVETAVPLSPGPYEGTPQGTLPGTPMGTLPAQRGRRNAGFGLQEGGSRWDRARANEA